jgi:endonuclease/exonuclease/phosphatase family metal-dependent hydrolase
MKNNKDLLVGSFYIPHREQQHIEELSKSLEKIENHNITNIVLTGDFNCPDKDNAGLFQILLVYL